MTVCGIDPGMAVTGWGIVRSQVGGDPVYVGGGAITTPSTQALPGRLQRLFQAVGQLFQRFTPEAVAIEELFLFPKARTTAATGQARGVILLAAAEAGLPVFEYNPRRVKMAVTGFGSADKGQMQLMVQRLLTLPQLPVPDDVADALALALCHLQTVRLPSPRTPPVHGGEREKHRSCATLAGKFISQRRPNA